MKKLFIVFVAVMAMGLVSCGNKSSSQAPADETVVASAADVNMDNATNDIAAQLESGDANKLQAAIEAAQEKVAQLLKENPEVAKEYLTKVQDFLKENAEKVKSVVGDNAAVQLAVSTLTDTPAETIISGIQAKLDAVGEAGQQTIDAAQTAGEQVVDAAKQAAQDKVDEAKKAAQDKVNEAQQKANEAVDKAVEDAKKKANEVNEAAIKAAMKGLER